MALLAVDLGLRTGLAHLRGDGRLAWARSHHVGTMDALRRAAWATLAPLDGLRVVALEGGGPVALPWTRAAERRGARVLLVQAHVWREALLLPRERRPGLDPKAPADALARRVIAWSGLPQPKALRHDAAEAILIGLWAAREVGLIAAFPDLRG